MRVAALILGIIGSLVGLLSEFAFLTFASIGKEFTNFGGVGVDSSTVLTLSWVAVGCFVMGLIGACLSLARTRFASKVMIFASVVGFLFSAGTPLTYIMNGLLFVAGIFAWIGEREIPVNKDSQVNDSSNESLLHAWLNARKKSYSDE